MPRIAVNSLSVIGLLTILVGTGAAIFFFGGFFSVAANDPDPDIVNWALIHVREASIARYATDQPSGPLDDTDAVHVGARAYSELGCTNCHGGPGVRPAILVTASGRVCLPAGARVRRRAGAP